MTFHPEPDCNVKLSVVVCLDVSVLKQVKPNNSDRVRTVEGQKKKYAHFVCSHMPRIIMVVYFPYSSFPEMTKKLQCLFRFAIKRGGGGG